MGSKLNVMVLADSLHHDNMRNISIPISDGLTLLRFGFNHEKFTPPPLRETTQKLLEVGGGGEIFFLFLALIFTEKKSVRRKIPAPAPARP